MPRGVYPRKLKTLKERFWAKVTVGDSDECWIWGAATREGYGRIMLEDRSLVDAHRLSFFWANGRWPAADCRHWCHTPACVNPAHLLEGTRKQNMQDMVDAGRSLRGERNPNAKLTWPVVQRVREQHAAGVGPTALAREAGVSERTMRQCLAGDTWMESGER